MEFEFLITNTPEDWRSWKGKNWAVDEGGITLKKDPIATYAFPESVISLEGKVPGDADIADMALDECGILYFLEAMEGEIYRYDPKRNAFERLCFSQESGWKDTSPRFIDPRGIWVTKNSIYIVDAGGKRLYSVSKHLLQTRWIVGGDTFKNPVDLVVDDHEDIYVLDAGVGAIIKVSKGGHVSGTIVKGLKMPLDIAIDDSGNIYVLDEEHERKGYTVRRFVPGPEKYVSTDRLNQWIPPEEFHVKDTEKSFQPSCIAVGKEGELFVGEASGPKAEEGEKSLLRYLPREKRFARVLSYRGSAHKLIMDPWKNIYAITGDKREVHFLEYVQKNQFNENTSLYSGHIYKRLDSGKPGTRWHRFKLGFEALAPGTQIQVSYFATDDETLDEKDINWQPIGLPNPRDALLHGDATTGRYLWVRIDLLGSEYDSPRITSLRVYFPRRTYLRYLPAIYQEDEASREFLEGFLSLFESFFVDIEEEIEGVTRYFDPRGVPSEYISWLGSWLALRIDETWTETKKRKLLARAPALFKMRGTRYGLQEILEIYLEDGLDSMARWRKACRLEKEALDRLLKEGYLTEESRNMEMAEYQELMVESVKRAGRLPGIFEFFQLECIKEKEPREIYRQLVGCPQCFLVLLPPWLKDEEVRTIRRIVDSEKPAHTMGRVISLKPWIQLGGHAYLGINAILPVPGFALDESRLGKTSVLTEREEYAHLELKSRIGVDTVIT